MNPAETKPTKSLFLNREIAVALLRKGKSFGLTPLLFLVDSAGVERVLHLEPANEGESKFLKNRQSDPRFRRVESLSIPARHSVVQFNYIGQEDILRPFHEWVAKTFLDRTSLQFVPDIYTAGFHSLEVYHPKANKKDTLMLWAGEMGCGLEEITAFGDNLNDLDLFEAGGRSVAVANAHPDVLQAADELTASNDEHGVARYLANLLGYEIPVDQQSAS